jgi:hypothetical protein
MAERAAAAKVADANGELRFDPQGPPLSKRGDR